jgi:hypothetical protein
MPTTPPSMAIATHSIRILAFLVFAFDLAILEHDHDGEGQPVDLHLLAQWHDLLAHLLRRAEQIIANARPDHAYAVGLFLDERVGQHHLAFPSSKTFVVSLVRSYPFPQEDVAREFSDGTVVIAHSDGPAKLANWFKVQ